MPPATLTRDQSRQVDRRAMEEYGIPGLVLMENAGRGAADVLCRLLAQVAQRRGRPAADRHLLRQGEQRRRRLCHGPAPRSARPSRERAGLGRARRVAGRRGGQFPHHPAGRPATGVVRSRSHCRPPGRASVGGHVDRRRLVGHRRRGEPRPPLDAVIDQLNAAAALKLAIDLPSGLDCDTGEPAGHTIRARHTCTFVAAKRGFLFPAAKPYLGRVHVLDIGAREAGGRGARHRLRSVS